MLELITPEAKTRMKAKPARAENRRSVGSVISGRLPAFEPDAAAPSTPETSARIMMPPTQADTPTRCRPSELMAPSWSAELAECPISADGTSPMRASTSVAASPPWVRTPKSAVVTTAAMMTTASHALPVSMSVMK